MAAGYFLNDRDRNLLNDVIRRVVGARTGSSLRLTGDSAPHGSPDMYIAKIPDGGIPALTLGGSNPDAVGVAECDVYKLIDGELRPAGFAKPVHNLSESAIPAGYAPIARDKFGRWLALSASGGGGSGSIPPRSEVWGIEIAGKPTGGTFDIDVTINGVTETLTFAYNADAAAVLAEFESHSEIGSGDVATLGGALPNRGIEVAFQGALANTTIIIKPEVDHSGLTGGSGVIAFVSRWQPGYAGS